MNKSKVNDVPKPKKKRQKLTREFDKKGVNLSGGESQKIAIARVFARPFELIIMDEPSSALDPVSEYNLNQSILEFAHDKTVLFISHRLSTTRSADKIYMFDAGQIVECGSHGELMSMGGSTPRCSTCRPRNIKRDERNCKRLINYTIRKLICEYSVIIENSEGDAEASPYIHNIFGYKRLQDMQSPKKPTSKNGLKSGCFEKNLFLILTTYSRLRRRKACDRDSEG